MGVHCSKNEQNSLAYALRIDCIVQALSRCHDYAAGLSAGLSKKRGEIL